MQSIRYLRPTSISEVVGLLSDHGAAAKLLAGGTDVLVRLRSGREGARVIIDVKRVRELSSEIVVAGPRLRVGALATMADLINDQSIRRDFLALAEAARVVGSVQIRNRATLIGNICNASPAADTAPPLLAYGALVNVVGVKGPRQVLLSEFFLGPGQTVLERGELIHSLDLPLPSVARGAAFGRITRRRGVDLATINLCCLVDRTGETRFAYGAVGPLPFLVRDTDRVLAGRLCPPEVRDHALQGLVLQAQPISDLRAGRDYRSAMLRVMSRRTLDTALRRLDQEAGL